jgi:hypothetical protein
MNAANPSKTYTFSKVEQKTPPCQIQREASVSMKNVMFGDEARLSHIHDSWISIF